MGGGSNHVYWEIIGNPGCAGSAGGAQATFGRSPMFHKSASPRSQHLPQQNLRKKRFADPEDITDCSDPDDDEEYDLVLDANTTNSDLSGQSSSSSRSRPVPRSRPTPPRRGQPLNQQHHHSSPTASAFLDNLDPSSFDLSGKVTNLWGAKKKVAERKKRAFSELWRCYKGRWSIRWGLQKSWSSRERPHPSRRTFRQKIDLDPFLPTSKVKMFGHEATSCSLQSGSIFVVVTRREWRRSFSASDLCS